MYDNMNAPIGFNVVLFESPRKADADGRTYWYKKNLQGEIIGLYSEAGQEVATYLYDPYGNIISRTYTPSEVGYADYNRLFYRGYYYDNDLGLYYLGSRYYDANIGRFISPDDISYLGANGDLNAFNLYAYCSNNPVMYSDPTGRVAISTLIILAIVGCTIGFAATTCADYADDGEVFNGSIDVSSYVANTLVVGLVAVTAGYTATAFGGTAVASPVLVSGYAVSASSAQAAVVGASAAAGLLLFANRSKKEMSTDHPGWVNKDMVDPNLSAQENAKKILNDRYGVGNWKKGPTTEFNRIVKWIARKLFYKR